MLQGCKTTNNTHTASQTRLTPFGINYAKVESSDLENYGMVIVEPDHYSKIQVDSLKQSGVRLIAYTSLGEVNKSRWYYPLLEERGFLGVNKNWNSSYLNLADSTTRNILLDDMIPEIMIKGFDGLFLDTVDDVAPYTERAHLQPYMAEMIKRIDKDYPDAFIIQNAGLFLLDKTKGHIDAVLIEDIATTYDFGKKEYELHTKEAFSQRVDTIRKYAEASGKPFLLVDFGLAEAFKAKVRSRLDSLSMPYFISTIELDTLARNPRN